jgi:hypothetical protein
MVYVTTPILWHKRFNLQRTNMIHMCRRVKCPTAAAHAMLTCAHPHSAGCAPRNRLKQLVDAKVGLPRLQTAPWPYTYAVG